MSRSEIDFTRLRRDHSDRADEALAATRTVLHGIDRGLHSPAEARELLEALGLITPLRVPKKRRRTPGT